MKNVVYTLVALLTVSLVTPCYAKPTSNVSEPESFQVILEHDVNIWTATAPVLPSGQKYGQTNATCETGSDLVVLPIASNQWMIGVPLGAKTIKFETIVCGEGFCRPESFSWRLPNQPWSPWLRYTLLFLAGMGFFNMCLSLYIWRMKCQLRSKREERSTGSLNLTVH